MDKLLPCPFCGGEAMLEFTKERKGYGAAVACGCSANIYTVTLDTEAEAEAEAIAAWNRRADHIRDTTKKVSNADRVRGMSDEELAAWILENIDCDKENIMCCPGLYKNSGKCNGRCVSGRLNWLKQEVKE